MGKFLPVFKYFLLLLVLQCCSKQNETVRLYRVKRGWLSSGRPTGVKCAFNPCSVPGFCGTGRTCEMDENCRHHCECETSSTHEMCAEIAAAQVASPKPMKCTFDPCASPAFACDGGRKCVLDELCMPDCKCVDDSIHSACQDNTETTTKHVSETSTPVDKCETGEISCIHGQCAIATNKYTCKCDKGWGGDTCNETQCVKQCSEGYYCHFVTSSVQICLESIQDIHTVSTVSVTPVTRETRVINVCHDEYQTRDKKERECSSGFTCQYGVCKDKGGEQRCQCDPGASGVLCDIKCCRDCGQLGVCVIDKDLTEICTCHNNYTGINCTMMLDLNNGKRTLYYPQIWHLTCI